MPEKYSRCQKNSPIAERFFATTPMPPSFYGNIMMTNGITLKIGGLQKNSMIDYPGRLSCVLFLAGCNFDCPYCHNPDLATGCSSGCDDLTFENFLGFIERRQGFLDAVVISGGEPTLHPELTDVCKQIRQHGYPVKLDTNGSRPQILKELINEGLVDYVAMDIKTDPLRYETFIKKGCDVSAVLASIQLILDSGIEHEFRTTCVKPIVTSRIIEKIAALIKGARLFAIQRFRKNGILHPEFFQTENCEYTYNELVQFKSLVSDQVQRCIVR